ncbi:neprilysin-1-like isoform X2 [Ornithodoros turicata]|uniref:neprilysin-1-like isoform X2 n=1 Tax=Ornithodoros turicata TaxID=34597 RepID=UPI0031392150
MTDAGQTTESAATSVPQNEANLPSPSVVQRRCLRPQYCVYTAAVTVVLTLCSLGIYLASRSKLSSAMCRTRPCSHFSKILNKTINYSMNPCTDFYKYVCAGWKTSPIAPARSVFENYENSIAKIILERVLRERVPLKRQTAFQKAARLIQTCVDVKRNAHLSAETLRQLMASVGFQWPLPSETDAIELFVEVSLNWGLQIWGSLTVDRIVRDDNGRPLVTFSNSLHYFNWLRRKQEMKNTGTYFAYVKQHVMRFWTGPVQAVQSIVQKVLVADACITNTVIAPFSSISTAGGLYTFSNIEGGLALMTALNKNASWIGTAYDVNDTVKVLNPGLFASIFNHPRDTLFFRRQLSP